MKAIDFISGTVMEYIPQFNKKESNFKVRYHVKFSKNKKIFGKDTPQMALKKFSSNSVLTLRQ